jgi:hypothetical protein
MAIQRKVKYIDTQIGARLRAATKRVSTVDLLRNFGLHSDAALAGPIILTKSGRDRLVLMSIEQYEVLQKAYQALQLTGADTVASTGRNGRTI